MKRGGRHETCKVCGKDWNVSLQLILPEHGYICPHCRGLYNKEVHGEKSENALPDHETDALCRTLIGGVRELFKDPAVQADFKRWQQERQQKLQGAKP